LVPNPPQKRRRPGQKKNGQQKFYTHDSGDIFISAPERQRMNWRLCAGFPLLVFEERPNL
jgi:hypothetical protein